MMPRPRDRDIGEAALFLQCGEAAFIERSLRGEHAFLPAGQEHAVELQPLGGVYGHDRDLALILIGVIVHDEADMLQKRAQRFVILHCAGKLVQVLQPPIGFGGALGLQHRGIAAFVEQDAGQLGMGQLARHVAPAADIGDEIGEGAPGLRRQLVGAKDMPRRDQQGRALGAGETVDLLDRLVAETALGHVNDALERQIVRRLRDQPQISQRIADFCALIEAKAADDSIGQADLNEAVLELARLELGAHEDGEIVERLARAMQPLHRVADGAGFLRPVPHADDLHLLAHIGFGPQRLAEPLRIALDHARCRAQYMRRGAVILFEANGLRAGEIPLEPQDIGDLRAAPAIDGLVVVAHAADILALLGEEAQPEILAAIGVLIFVHHDVAEALLIGFQHLPVLAQQRQRVEQQVAEIAGVEGEQPRLIGGVHLLPRAIGVMLRLASVDIGGGQPLVLPLVDKAGQLPGGPAFLVYPFGLNELLQQAQLVVGVEDGEIALQAHQLGMAA